MRPLPAGVPALCIVWHSLFLSLVFSVLMVVVVVAVVLMAVMLRLLCIRVTDFA